MSICAFMYLLSWYLIFSLPLLGLHLIFLPYADDKRNIDFTEQVPANQEQVDKMKEIVQKLRFKYR